MNEGMILNNGESNYIAVYSPNQVMAFKVEVSLNRRKKRSKIKGISFACKLSQKTSNMKFKYSAFCFLIIAASCNNNTHQITESDTASPAADTTSTQNFENKTDTSLQVTSASSPKNDTLLTVNMDANNKGSVSSYLSGVGKHVTILVPVKKGDSILAELIPETDTANIRFTQIYVPVGEAGKYDGPFGKTLNYPITVKGTYKLIVGESLMAEGDWKGNFTCNVTIK